MHCYASIMAILGGCRRAIGSTSKRERFWVAWRNIAKNQGIQRSERKKVVASIVRTMQLRPYKKYNVN